MYFMFWLKFSIFQHYSRQVRNQLWSTSAIKIAYSLLPGLDLNIEFKHQKSGNIITINGRTIIQGLICTCHHWLEDRRRLDLIYSLMVKHIESPDSFSVFVLPI